MSLHLPLFSSVLDLEELQSQWADLSTTLLNSRELLGGVAAMVKRFNHIKGNPSKLLSALHMFGWEHGATARLASQRAKTLRRLTNRAGPTITAQVTSVARRKMKVGGRRRLTGGRPKKSGFTTSADHRYTVPKGVRSDSHSFAAAVEGGRSNAK